MRKISKAIAEGDRIEKTTLATEAQKHGEQPRSEMQKLIEAQLVMSNFVIG
jgi:hypothetical protein